MAIFSYPIYMHLEYISDRNYKQTKILQFYNIIIDESVIQFFSYFIWDLTQDFIFNSIETLGDSFGIPLINQSTSKSFLLCLYSA